MNPRDNPRDRAGLLLEAAVADSTDRLQSCWSSWRQAAGDYERLQSLEGRLLPQVWRRLYDAGLEHTADRRLRGLYKKTFFYNHNLLSVAADLQQSLRDVGVESVLFKGVAMMLTAYPDIGLRKSADIDLYVSPRDFRRADRLLRGRYDGRSCWGHAIHYWSRDRRGVDLHRHTSQWATIRPAPEVDAELLQRARPVRWQGRELVVPAPTDLMYHSLINAFSQHAPSETDHLYWLLDARQMADRLPLDVDRLTWLIRFQRSTPLWLHHFQRVEALLPADLRELLARLRASPLREDERRLDAALHAVEAAYAGKAERVPYMIWWLTLRGVPGGGPLRSLGVKGGYVVHRLGVALGRRNQERQRPVTLRHRVGTFATGATLLFRHGGH